jgi:uncharacterized membrane protein
VSERRTRTYTRYTRESVEFGRVLSFSDGLFAIAMTLLVVAIGIPTLSDGDSVNELAEALNDLSPELISFFISFAVIGRYWVAHHLFFAQLDAMDRGLIALNLIYLAFIAFLPFPTALLGEYFENPLSVVIYAVNVGLVSGMEVVLFRHAHRKGLLSAKLPVEVYRWGAAMQLFPVAFFLASIPVAFLNTGVAVAMWVVSGPLGALVNSRWAPEGSDERLIG